MRSSHLLVLLLLTGCVAPITLRYSPNLVEQKNLPYGLPECSGRLLNKGYFAICFVEEWLTATWVGHYVTPEDLAEQWPRHQRFFHRDRELSSELRVDTTDYEGSGYDRGHLAPAGDFKRSLPALRATFVMSNMSPQTAELNRGQWRNLEHSLRRRLPQGPSGMLVYTGNLFLDSAGRPVAPTKRIGVRQVAVPSHCFKIALFDYPDGRVELYAFIMANSYEAEEKPLSSYQVTVDELERLTGVDFFRAWTDAEAREAEIQPFRSAE